MTTSPGGAINCLIQSSANVHSVCAHVTGGMDDCAVAPNDRALLPKFTNIVHNLVQSDLQLPENTIERLNTGEGRPH